MYLLSKEYDETIERMVGECGDVPALMHGILRDSIGLALMFHRYVEEGGEPKEEMRLALARMYVGLSVLKLTAGIDERERTKRLTFYLGGDPDKDYDGNGTRGITLYGREFISRIIRMNNENSLSPDYNATMWLNLKEFACAYERYLNSGGETRGELTDNVAAMDIMLAAMLIGLDMLDAADEIRRLIGWGDGDNNDETEEKK